MKLKSPTIAKDALYNCARSCTNVGTFDGITGLNPAQCYGQGIVNGMVAAFMACGDDFAVALHRVTAMLPTDFDGHCMPVSWRTKDVR